MKRELIIGCRLFLMNTATHCVEKVYRIDDGKMSLIGINNKEYRLPRDEGGIEALIDALKMYVLNLRTNSKDLSTRKSKHQKKFSKNTNNDDLTTEFYINPNTFASLPIKNLRHSPGFAIYMSGQRGIQVYLADKEDGDDGGTAVTEGTHTERQLISEICKINEGNLDGRLYIYTELPPCSEPSHKKTSCKETCVQFYNDFIKKQNELNVYIMYTGQYKGTVGKNSYEPEGVYLLRRLLWYDMDRENINELRHTKQEKGETVLLDGCNYKVILDSKQTHIKRLHVKKI